MKNNLYDSDYYSWAYQQAQLIREGKFNKLDIENLIEEIEDMGRSQYRALKSALRELQLHLLKWQMQSAKVDDLHDMERWYISWLDSIAKQRRRVVEELDENPGLKNKLDEILTTAYQQACKAAATDMKCRIKDFPTECPWTFEQIMTDNWLP
ncbi:DUF29 domain-containing protein [Endozoicomonas sp. ONNA1]|uniref:DUF29 domain-containing protein n=1 Tax=Endozoicomonas sp. ONNA1 TaxID=2828740 RepID=UPI002148054E|nr:DUF29 domain-containing protein [Endozoicomonas sp. ONNA1]